MKGIAATTTTNGDTIPNQEKPRDMMVFDDEEEEEDDMSEVGGQSSRFMTDDDDDETTTNNNNQSRKDQHKTNLDLVSATREDSYVWKFRFLTTLALICAAVAVCVTVVIREKSNEKESFEVAFHELGGQLVTNFEKHVHDRVAIVGKFAMELTTEAANSNSNNNNHNNGSSSLTWPFFTPASYESRAMVTSELAELTQLFLLPRVVNASLQEWEDYSVKNQQWIKEGLIAQGKKEPNAKPIAPFVYNIRQGKPTPMNMSYPKEIPIPQFYDTFFPIWTQYPATSRGFANLNIYGNQEEGFLSIDSVLQSQKPSFPRSIDYWDDPPEEREKNFIFQRVKLTFPDYNGDPFCTTYYPVYDHLGDDNDSDYPPEIVAVLMGGVIWKSYFESILPEGTANLIVILENQCLQNYTYEVGGMSAQFISHGDLHNNKYDYLELGTSIHSILGYDSTKDDVPIHRGNCAYSIRVYPSDEFEQSFYTNQPKIYALALAAVFVVTCSVFLLYDYMVEQRQRAVMKSALQSGKLIRELFPEDALKRLYEEEEAKRQKQQQNVWTQEQEQEQQKQDPSLRSPTSNGNANAIATLYPETTIFFADLAGFTKWSSTRTPVEVFDLLETIYGNFDKLARKYKVFKGMLMRLLFDLKLSTAVLNLSSPTKILMKVETIGDCYVACTGLPQAQPDHAVRMCRFARSCMTRFHVVTAEVADSLGEDTMELEMRVGLHSGPVTAGVLRGDKGRFQLFGDSVNTASRMESNGVKGRIHVSQSTADELEKAGKGVWLTPREEKIVAKGKGEMQTFWVQVTGGATTMSQTTMSQSSLPSQGSRRNDQSDGHPAASAATTSTMSTSSLPSEGSRRDNQSTYADNVEC